MENENQEVTAVDPREVATQVEDNADHIDWEAKAKELEAVIAKQAAQKKETEKQRDLLKQKVKTPLENPEVTAYLKEELAKVSAQQQKYVERAKSGAIKVAASSKLSAMGINPQALDLAVAQLDKSLVQYDEDTDSVDDTALSAAVSKLKSQHPFLFEKTVGSPKVRTPAEGSSRGDSNTISREDWQNMTTKEQRAAILSGRRVE